MDMLFAIWFSLPFFNEYSQKQYITNARCLQQFCALFARFFYTLFMLTSVWPSTVDSPGFPPPLGACPSPEPCDSGGCPPSLPPELEEIMDLSIDIKDLKK